MVEYGVPTLPFATPQVPQSRLMGDLTTINVQITVSVFPLASTTFETKVYMPGVVGVPLMTPVELFSVNPGGSDPRTIEYVYGAVPPLASSDSE